MNFNILTASACQLKVNLGTRVLGGRDILCPHFSLPLFTTPHAFEPQGAVLCLPLPL